MNKMKISKFKKDCNDYGISNIRLLEASNHGWSNAIDIKANIATSATTKHEVAIRALTLQVGLELLIEKAKLLKEIDSVSTTEKEDHCGDDPNAYYYLKNNKFEIID
jgi:hypothetical protein